MSLKKIQNEIGKRLRNLRTAKNLSQEQVSLEIKISRDHLSNIENGKFPINIKTLYKLSCFYEVKLEYFFEGLKY
ncbi:helix-turn-helix transcriptional regulator [bacterium]|nr:helix-turn-helix transcriptional regulator [bacterium]